MAESDLRDDYAEAVPLPGITPTRSPYSPYGYLRLSRKTVDTGRRGVAAARAALNGAPVDDGGEGERHTSAA